MAAAAAAAAAVPAPVPAAAAAAAAAAAGAAAAGAVIVPPGIAKDCAEYVKLKLEGSKLKDKLRECEDEVLNYVRLLPGQTLKLNSRIMLCIQTKKTPVRGWTNKLLSQVLSEHYRLDKTKAEEDVKQMLQIRTKLMAAAKKQGGAEDAEDGPGRKEYLHIKFLDEADGAAAAGGGGASRKKKAVKKEPGEPRKTRTQARTSSNFVSRRIANFVSHFVCTQKKNKAVKQEEDLR